MTSFKVNSPCVQQVMAFAPYDHWVTPAGEIPALFYRTAKGYLIRFTHQADFAISDDLSSVVCTPVPEAESGIGRTLYCNAIQPLIANHLGGISLHASAVCIDGRAVAFLGPSRMGKTTLAAAFARQGYPFLTEDVLNLEASETGYIVQPARPVLRLFGDSAAELLGTSPTVEPPQTARKTDIEANDLLPHADKPVALGALLLLGAGQCNQVTVQALEPASALARLMQHAFILDVEDKPRLRGHFDRIAELADAVRCYELDYPRRYDHLPTVIEAIIGTMQKNGMWHEVQ